MSEKKQGPNVKKLIVRKMSLLAVPPGGGLGAGLAFLMDKDRITSAAREATEWVEAALAAVKAAPNNPYGDDDEAIAGKILEDIEARKPAYATPSGSPDRATRRRGEGA